MLLKEKKEIIIGSAINYNYRDLYFFVASLRKNYKDKILFFVSQSIDNETLAFFKKFNISLIKTKLNPKLIFKYRYKLYLNYLKKNKYNKVMITDTRDVIFQKNPFKDKNFFELCFFQEDKKIYECEFNTNWLISLYGKKIYYKFKNNKIICSGTTIGKYKNIIDYLKKISTEIKKQK